MKILRKIVLIFIALYAFVCLVATELPGIAGHFLQILYFLPFLLPLLFLVFLLSPKAI